MAYKIVFKPSARREIEKLSRGIRDRVSGAIDALAYQPRPSGCKKLTNMDDLWRIRVGDWRVVYAIEDKCLIIMVVRIRHRREVYD